MRPKEISDVRQKPTARTSDGSKQPIPAESSKQQTGATTVRKALSILKLAASGATIRATTVAKALNVDKSTGSRLIRTLASEGFLMPIEDGAEYKLGPAILELATTINRGIDLPQLSFDLMTKLRDTTGETISIQRRMDDVRVCIAQVPSQHPIRWVIEVGEPRPLTAGAAAKVLLAGLSEAELRKVVRRSHLKRFTAYTLVGEELTAEIQKVRAQDYALNEGERVEGLSGISAPIRNGAGEIVAALAASGPSFRWTKERMLQHLPALKACAQQISSRIRDVSADISGSTGKYKRRDR